MCDKAMKKNREIQNINYRTVNNSRETGIHRSFKNVFYSFSCVVGYTDIRFIFSF